jgi:hypothetical protein
VASLSSGVVGVSLGADVGCALTTAGGVKCWGDNESGAVGDGTSTNRSTPVDVVGLTSGVVDVVVGFGHACALTSAGGVKCWGGNTEGELGTGTTSSDSVGSSTPVDVVGLGSDVVALSPVSPSGHHTCAVTRTGDVMCWGSNDHGELGIPSTTKVVSATPVKALSSAKAVAAGNEFTCAITSGGQAMCWGHDDAYQLGDGVYSGGYVDNAPPTAVVGLSGLTRMGAGGAHACAADATSVHCWGSDIDAELGDGHRGSDNPSPQPVVNVNAAVDLSLGLRHGCARLPGGAVRCWGSNGSGELGDGTNYEQDLPVDVSGL